MTRHIKSIIYGLINQEKGNTVFTSLNLSEQFNLDNKESWAVARALNTGFLISLTDGLHPKTLLAKEFIRQMSQSSIWAELSEFYQEGIELIHDEIDKNYINNPDFKRRLESLEAWITHRNGSEGREEMRDRIC